MSDKPNSIQPCIPGIWSERWKKLKEMHVRSVNTTHEDDFWMNPENVGRYLENIRGSYGEVVREQLRTMSIPLHARVLDIGAGAGTLAVPLAKLGCDVTVVEQAPLMCAALEEYRISENAPPVTIISRRWEDVNPRDLGVFDVTIASYSLTMADIAGTVRSIQEVTSGKVYLFWFLTPPSWASVMHDLWPLLHRKPYYPSPLADCLWNVLYEMGIYAHVEVMNPAPPRTFDTIEHAVSYMAGRLECTEDWQREMVRSYFSENLRPTGNGTYIFEEGHRSAKIWWDNALMANQT